MVVVVLVVLGVGTERAGRREGSWCRNKLRIEFADPRMGAAEEVLFIAVGWMVVAWVFIGWIIWISSSESLDTMGRRRRGGIAGGWWGQATRSPIILWSSSL